MTSYTYHRRGLITRVDSPVGSSNYTFDARGAATKRHLPNGTCTYYAYDAAGRVSGIADRKSDGTAITSFEFTRDPNGNITKALREDDSCWYYEYDGLQRLTAAEWKDSGGGSLYAFEYEYDKVGNRTSLVFNGESTYYTYNEANELTQEQTLGGDTTSYTYDGRGNLTAERRASEAAQKELEEELASLAACATLHSQGLGRHFACVLASRNRRYVAQPLASSGLCGGGAQRPWGDKDPGAGKR